MLAKRFQNLSVGSPVSYAGIENLVFDGTCYDFAYLIDKESKTEEKVSIDQFNLYGKHQ